MFVGSVWRTRLGAFEEVWVVATFAQLHDDVEEASLGFLVASTAVHSVNVLFENLLVPLYLHVRHANV